MSLLAIQNLTVRFGGLTAVNAVDFGVEPGQIYAVIGPNGAGKTTVFNAITGVYEPSSGEIVFEGRPIRRPFSPRHALGFAAADVMLGCLLVVMVNVQTLWDAAIGKNYVYKQPFPWRAGFHSFWQCLHDQPYGYTVLPFVVSVILGGAAATVIWARARRTPDYVAVNGIARTFQNIRLFPEMTVVENVLVGMHARLRTNAMQAALRLPQFWREKTVSDAKACELLNFVGVTDAGAVAKNLSYGHQRRVEIARALAGEPRLLLLDEPAAGMNPSETAELMKLIRKIRDRGVSVLLIEHDMKLVMGVSDRIAVLDYGNKIAEGTPEEVRNDPKVTAAYLGAPDAA